MTRDQLIETMARASVASRNLPEGCDINWDTFIRDATAALTAIEAAGMRVVPVENDPTNPFAPRERPKKSIRLMTDAERRAAGLDPNSGFDGPTGAD